MNFVFFIIAVMAVSRLHGQMPHANQHPTNGQQQWQPTWHGPNMCRSSPTSADVLGPYYFPGAPYRRQICDHDPEISRLNLPVLLVEGRILDTRCMPVIGAKIEVWQADHDGEYDQAAHCRGHFFSGRSGHYAFLTIHPGKYTVDGAYRPAHVHFRVEKQGFNVFVTQMYFRGDSNLGQNDSCTACHSDRQDIIVDTELMCADSSGSFCFNMTHFDITLTRGDDIDVVQDVDETEAELRPRVING